jgi:ribosomal protein S18 acetylase RimI-like enzyme
VDTLPGPGVDAPAAGTIWLLDLDSSAANHVASRIPTSFQRIGAEEAFVLTQAMGGDETVPLQRFSRRRRCYAARAGDVLVAYGWVTLEDKEEIGELGLHAHLEKGEAYIWDCVTLPAYRGQRLYPALLTYIIDVLRVEGFRRIWIGADTDNTASQSGMILVGFQPLADIVIDHAHAPHKLWLRGRPGVPEHLVIEARRLLFGTVENL